MARTRTTRFAHDLPASRAPLFGREEDRARVLASLAEGSLVTLSGPGGIGKSRLARDVARTFAREDVALCALEAARDRAMAESAIAHACGVSAVGAGRGDSAAALAKKIAARGPILVLLDDADAVVEAVATLVRACLGAAPAVRFLVTSREALGIDGERVIALGPLGRDAGIAMFEARAEGTRGTREELEALVEHLDGLPLAIELAARRARLVPPRELLLRLDERFRLLKTDRRDVPERHATLAATLAWSWERLTADERCALACLGAFEMPVTVDAFESVIGPLLKSDPIDVAERLLRKSLLAHVDRDGAARVTMLQSVMAFAREKLADVKRRSEIEERHAHFYLERAERAAAQAYGPHAEHALDSLEAALPNLLAAFAREKARAPELAARIVVALGDLALFRDSVDLRSPLFTEARCAADATPYAELRVRARILEAKVILEVGAPSAAAALLEEARAIADAARLEGAGALAERSLGWALLAMGRADEARVLLERARDRHRSAGDVRGEADALAARGLILCMRGEGAEGARDLDASFALHVASGDALRRDRVIDIAKIAGVDLARAREEAREEPSAEEQAARLRASADAHRASGRQWREALDRLRLADLEGTRARAPEAASSAHDSRACWTVAPDARWLSPPAGSAIDLARHGSLRRVLDALVARRLCEPGAATPACDLIEAGWPGERARRDSVILRVYSSIRRLRALGLGGALVTRDDGYLLDPDVPFVRADSPPRSTVA